MWYTLGQPWRVPEWAERLGGRLFHRLAAEGQAGRLHLTQSVLIMRSHAEHGSEKAPGYGSSIESRMTRGAEGGRAMKDA